MATSNKKVTGYIPPELYQAFQQFVEKQGLPSDSAGLVQLMRDRFEQPVESVPLTRLERLEQEVEALKAVITPSTKPVKPESEVVPPPIEPMSGRQLAKRMSCHHTTLQAARKGNFADWSHSRDPQGITWEYDEDKKQYRPVTG